MIRKRNTTCLLIIAPYSKASILVKEFIGRTFNSYSVVGIILTSDSSNDGITIDACEDIEGIPIVGTMDTMFDSANQNVVDEVLIWEETEDVSEIVNTFKSMGIVVHVCSKNNDFLPDEKIDYINGIPVVTTSVCNITTGQRAIKRLIDILFGIVGLIITVLLTIVITPMIMISDPGPIFFRQERVGKNGRIFKMWKFRTMYKDAEDRKAELMSQNKMDGLMFKMDDDPRIIGYGKKFSLGKFLRETSIDEFPQAINLLSGSMSLVGSRPPTKNEYEQYQYHHKGRLAMKPGITGMWQVSGRNNITDFEKVVELDKKYIENFSLMLDVKIILKTIKILVLHPFIK